jgi:hypothetical protein
MPVSLSTAPPIRSSNGSARADICDTGKLTFSPTFAVGSCGSIAMNHREHVAGSPVCGRGATIV